MPEFYRLQAELGDFASRSVGDVDEQRVEWIERLAGDGPKRILELGAGTGQTAVAAARMGHSVVAIELVPQLVQSARQLAACCGPHQLTVVAGDFYTLELEGAFDLVCYWDGFGIGTDDDQRRLLARCAAWLNRGGCVLMDVYTPWFWPRVAGKEMQVGKAMRRYGFDAEECRLLDTWWPINDKSRAVTQSLRCYSPADLRLLLGGTGLQLERVQAGGTLDVNTMEYQPSVPLAKSMQYVAKLRTAH